MNSARGERNDSDVLSVKISVDISTSPSKHVQSARQMSTLLSCPQQHYKEMKESTLKLN